MKIIFCFLFSLSISAQEIIIVDYVDTLYQINLERNYVNKDSLSLAKKYPLLSWLKRKKADRKIIVADFATNVYPISEEGFEVAQWGYDFWFSFGFFLNNFFENRVSLTPIYKEAEIEKIIRENPKAKFYIYGNSHYSSQGVLKRIQNRHFDKDISYFIRDISGDSVIKEESSSSFFTYYIYDQQLGVNAIDLEDQAQRKNLEKSLQYQLPNARSVDFSKNVDIMLREYRRRNGLLD